MCVQSNPGLQKLVAGAFGLPFGLAMVLICGAELFTGNTNYMACALFEGRISLKALLKNWVLSYSGAAPQHARRAVHLFNPAVCTADVTATTSLETFTKNRCGRDFSFATCWKSNGYSNVVV